MSVFDVIQRRRSRGKMSQERPTRKQIEQILAAATYAPNHHKVEPWHFFVLSGTARNELGEIMARSLATRQTDFPESSLQALLAKERNKPLRAPVLIIAVAAHMEQPKVLDIENIEATAAAVENMLLVAEEKGLACMWRTGDAAYDPAVKRWLGINEQDTIVGIIYVGYATQEPAERHPQPLAEKTIWLGWQE